MQYYRYVLKLGKYTSVYVDNDYFQGEIFKNFTGKLRLYEDKLLDGTYVTVQKIPYNDDIDDDVVFIEEESNADLFSLFEDEEEPENAVYRSIYTLDAEGNKIFAGKVLANLDLPYLLIQHRES